MKKTLLALLILFTALSLILTGCNISRKPAPKPAPGKMTPRTPTPTPSPTPTPKTTPPTTPAKKPAAPAHTAAQKLADVAKRVEGVKAATVVISGATATAGIETQPDIEAKKTDEVKTKVAQEIKKADSSIKTVYVTTDPNIITRIKKVAEGIKNGRPVSEFAKELEEIGRRITPSEKKPK